MIRITLWAALAVSMLIISGCGMIFVARSYDSTPAYCFDCHHRGVWHVAYTRCEYYQIKIVHDGYYYRPRHDHRHSQYVFKAHDSENSKQVRERREKENNREKDTKPNREKDSRIRGGQ